MFSLRVMDVFCAEEHSVHLWGCWYSVCLLVHSMSGTSPRQIPGYSLMSLANKCLEILVIDVFWVCFQLGVVHLEQKHNAEARRCFEQALQINPDHTVCPHCHFILQDIFPLFASVLCCWMGWEEGYFSEGNKQTCMWNNKGLMYAQHSNSCWLWLSTSPRWLLFNLTPCRAGIS